MEDSNTKLDEWWEVTKRQFKEKMYKNLATHRKDEDMYRRHLSTLKKIFQILCTIVHIVWSHLV